MEAFSLLQFHIIILYSLSLAVSLLALVLLLDSIFPLRSTLVLILDFCKFFSLLTMEA